MTRDDDTGPWVTPVLVAVLAIATVSGSVGIGVADVTSVDTAGQGHVVSSTGLSDHNVSGAHETGTTPSDQTVSVDLSQSSVEPGGTTEATLVLPTRPAASPDTASPSV